MSESTMSHVQKIIANIFSAQNSLRSLAPEFNWRGMGNLLGDYGEFIAVNHYGFSKAKSGTKGHDVQDDDGVKIQVKTTHSGKNIKFRETTEKILVLKIHEDGSWGEIYFDDFAPILKLTGYSKRENRYRVSIKKLTHFSESG